MDPEESSSLPDISHEVKASVLSPIEKVGMSAIEMPLRIQVGLKEMTVPAQISAFVDLKDVEAKGIHMSRLYLSLQDSLEKNVLSLEVLKNLLNDFISSQKGLSQSSFFRTSFELPLKRKALLSEKMGWRQYPVFVEAQMVGGEVTYILGLQVAYSSTCPCSAALARQLIVKKFKEKFQGKGSVSASEVETWLQEEGLAATPHAQRSYADIKIQVKKEMNFIKWIDVVEQALHTPVQAAVKRIDEQEFARLNANHLMFCEDAARFIKEALDQHDEVVDYFIKVEHQESLHPHNAVSVLVKGVPNGFHV
ncbi:MAG: GTP cyclohydrolase I FolE2 [Bdellovibrio sp.]|nr:MAG: GTP cyclohydrolase I FolE2 [Bdellovibrio sp.]